jgi:hypothetical protein
MSDDRGVLVGGEPLKIGGISASGLSASIAMDQSRCTGFGELSDLSEGAQGRMQMANRRE